MFRQEPILLWTKSIIVSRPNLEPALGRKRNQSLRLCVADSERLTTTYM
jgi:hypothetical protein